MACISSEPELIPPSTDEVGPNRVGARDKNAMQSSALSAYDEAIEFRQQGDLARAVTALKRAIQLDEGSPSASLAGSDPFRYES